jgi:hypothetical protein
MWFGLNLVKREIITVDQLLAAVKAQRLSRPPLGRLALEHGHLTMEQVFDVLRLQADSTKLFGQLALEQGYLSEALLGRLLLIQSRREQPLVEVLAEQGFVSREQLDEEFSRFQREVTDLYGVFDLDQLLTDPSSFGRTPSCRNVRWLYAARR